METHTQLQDKVTVKLFIGYLISAEMRLLLSQSAEWKRDSILPQAQSLTQVHYQNKDYIGRFVTQECLTMPQFKVIDTEMRSSLHSYCPTLNLDSLLTFTFPQIFIS